MPDETKLSGSGLYYQSVKSDTNGGIYPLKVKTGRKELLPVRVK